MSPNPLQPNPLQPLPMNALINIYGISNVGKTSTLLELIALAKQSPSFRPILAYKNDWEIFSYKGKIVGVITVGDPGCEWLVDEFLNHCKQQPCNVIFTASRTRGEIFGQVIDWAQTNGYMFLETSPLFARQPQVYNGPYDFLHTHFALMLINLI